MHASGILLRLHSERQRQQKEGHEQDTHSQPAALKDAPMGALACAGSSTSRGKSSSEAPPPPLASEAAGAPLTERGGPAAPSTTAAAEAWEWAGDAGAGGVGAPMEPGADSGPPPGAMGMGGVEPPACCGLGVPERPASISARCASATILTSTGRGGGRVMVSNQAPKRGA